MWSAIKEAWREADAVGFVRDFQLTKQLIYSQRRDFSEITYQTYCDEMLCLFDRVGSFANIADDGRRKLAKHFKEEARKAHDFNLARSYGLYLCYAWLYAPLLRHASVVGIYKELDELLFRLYSRECERYEVTTPVSSEIAGEVRRESDQQTSSNMPSVPTLHEKQNLDDRLRSKFSERYVEVTRRRATLRPAMKMNGYDLGASLGFLDANNCFQNKKNVVELLELSGYDTENALAIWEMYSGETRLTKSERQTFEVGVNRGLSDFVG